MYWAPLIARETSIVLAIEWYIRVELLRTKQLPKYITHTGIKRRPSLVADIERQASAVYSKLFRKDDITNKFYVADTGQEDLDGKIGWITSYDFAQRCFASRIADAHQMRSSNFTDICLSTANMQPHTQVYTQTHVPHPSAETCTIRLEKHFSDSNQVLPRVTFHADVFCKIGGLTASPHTGGQPQIDKLVEMIETKESMAHADAENIRSQQAELKGGFSKLCATHSPAELRTEKKLQQTRRQQNISSGKLQINHRVSQVKAVWKAKIEHIISRGHGFEGIDRDDNDVHEHMFTYPFRTVDNSLHCSCVGLPEFSHCTGTEGLNDAVYGTNDIASSIIIDENSISSVVPGHEMDDNIMNFCLSW